MGKRKKDVFALKGDELRQYYFEVAQEIGSIGTWDLDLIKNILIWTDENYRIFGVPIGTPMNYEKFLSLLHPDDIEYVNSEWMAGVAGKPYDIEHRIIVNGQVKWVREKAEIQLNDKGEPIRAIGVTQDISYRKSVEQELSDAKNKAEEANRLKSSFLANMSHEIRTPMNGIIGFSKLLQTKQDISEIQRKKYLGYISTCCDNLLLLINDIIDISKIESNTLDVKMTSFDLVGLVVEIYNLFLESDKIKDGVNFDLTINLDESKFIITSDKLRLTQVINNIIGNALKFTTEGSIVIKIEKGDSGYINIIVKDTGSGVLDSEKEIIFDHFRQGNQINAPKNIGGTGLGLSISKHLMSLLNGSIELISKINEGSQFTISIPIGHEDGVPQNKNIEETRENNLSDKTVLIVEDNLINLAFIEEILMDKCKKIHSATSAEDGILICKEQDIDIVFMDINLPGMDGYQASKQIKSLDPTTLIIVQTGYAMTDDEVKVMEAGCDGYISKPIIPSLLIQKVSDLLKES